MKRRLATVLCTLAWIAAPAAQQPAPQTPAPQSAPALPTIQIQEIVPEQDAGQTRDALWRVLEQYPPSVRRVIALDASLLDNQTYMTPYPQLAAFIAQHPDVGRNPAYYFGSENNFFDQDPQLRAVAMMQDVATGAMIFIVFGSIAAFIGWLIKTFIDHRRWLHVSKVQTEAHNKLLDRLAGHEELLAYIQTPSGRRFLESAPVLDPAPRATSAPIGRVIWSAQIGVVLVFAGLGLHMAATGLEPYVKAPLSLIGSLAVAIGIGFVASAGAAYLLSRRLGLLEPRTNE